MSNGKDYSRIGGWLTVILILNVLQLTRMIAAIAFIFASDENFEF